LLSGLMVVKLPGWVARVAFIAAGLVAISYVVVLSTPLNRAVFHGAKAASLSSRQDFFRTGIKVARDYFPVGSGLGTFPSVYRIKEDPRTVDPSVFVNHAHDDYLEILIETGLPGILLVIAFLAWWLLSTVRLIRTPSVDRFALAGAIGAATIFVHSGVDYPLRTSAVAVSLAMCFSLMALPKSRESSEQDFRPTRHVEIH
jgi:O-antigen ligase